MHAIVVLRFLKITQNIDGMNSAIDFALISTFETAWPNLHIVCKNSAV